MFVHLADLDHFEHDYGPFTREAIDVLEKSDGYVARILNAYKEGGILDETAVFITSDHGFKPVSRDINPGVLLAKEGLVSLETSRNGDGNERPLVKDWKAAVYANAAYCAIYVSDWKDATTLRKVRKMFKDIEGKQGFGIHRVYDPEEVRSIGGDPKAALVLDPAEGYSCGGAYTGEYITNAVYKGNHGYHPDRPDFMASFIASGAGVSVRGSIGIINIYDVGPTVAKLLGFEISDAEGKPLALGRR
jgi:predicted AlkP superfamily pyrophosphatase or phosphodiesterase